MGTLILLVVVLAVYGCTLVVNTGDGSVKTKSNPVIKTKAKVVNKPGLHVKLFKEEGDEK